MYSFGILMDPIEQIDINKDSTIAIAKALQNKCKVYYIIPDTLHINNSKVYAKTAELKIYKNKKPFYEINNVRLKELTFLDCILFRLDPPVDEHYIQVTHILDLMESQGILVINSPQSIRDWDREQAQSNDFDFLSKKQPEDYEKVDYFLESFELLRTAIEELPEEEQKVCGFE